MSGSLIIRKSANRGREKSARSVPGTSRSVSHAQWWEEDLDDVIDVLRQEIPDTTHVSQTSLNNDLLTFATLPVQIASRPRITVQSDFPIFPVAQHLKLDEIDLGKLAGDTTNANFTDNTNQPSDITSVQTSPRVMDGAVSGPETSSPENSSRLKSFSKEDQGELLLQYSESEENGNASHARKPTNFTQASNKLFGILSLILQALNSPLTEVLEEYHAGALQRALMEIQSTVSIYNSVSDHKSVVSC